MEVYALIKKAQRKLSEIGTARLDALVLLEDVTGRDRAWLLAHPEHELSLGEEAKLEKLLNERAKHTPLAYVRGRTEFYGRDFVITPAVLEPRPESEMMIDLLKELWESGKIHVHNDRAESKKVRIADVGAGSGALGITAKLELTPSEKISVDLLEIDTKALKVAKINVDKYTTSISVIASDLLARSKKNYDVLLCNLPYVPDSHTINEAAMHEPKLAIFGGTDGLDVYRRLFGQIQHLKKRPLYILLESLPPQHDALAALAAESGYQLYKTNDFVQVFSIVD